MKNVVHEIKGGSWLQFNTFYLFLSDAMMIRTCINALMNFVHNGPGIPVHIVVCLANGDALYAKHCMAGIMKYETLYRHLKMY